MSGNCGNCRFWSDPEGTSKQIGLCRRNSPVADENSEIGVWPTTYDYDWCGQYQPKSQPIERDDD